jgi:GGDEF domain-containing protein
MSLQGPILIVANKPAGGLVKAFTDAGGFPVVEATWAGAPTAMAEVKPSAIMVSEPEPRDHDTAAALARQAAEAAPLIPLLIRVRENTSGALPDALTISEDASVEQIIARLSAALRVRTLHATVLGRAQALKAERNIVAEMPEGDPLNEATVLLMGRGRHHATLSVAIGERMGVIGALSVDTAARCLEARDVDGIFIGDGLSAGTVDAFLTLLSQNARLRELPVAMLATGNGAYPLPNFIRASDPLVLLPHAIPAIRLRALETALKRLLQSIECKGMLDAQTGLLNANAFGEALGYAINDAGERGTGLSLARFTFEDGLDHRTSMDAARLISRLVRDTDFACRQDDGTILFVFGDTDLRNAHVVARRLASVLKHTMLRPDRDRPNVSPSVTLATMKPTDTVLTLLARVAPRPVAAA